VTGLDLRELVARLVGADVEFILVGGLAVNAWGHIRTYARSGHRSGSVTDQSRLPQVPRFAELDRDAVTVDLGDHLRIRVCSLQALLAMKRAANRPSDVADVDALEIANRLTPEDTEL